MPCFFLLVSLIYVAGCRHKTLAKPEFPPQTWQFKIDITLSDDLVLPFLKEKPSEDEFIPVDSLSFWLNSDTLLDPDASLLASRSNPVITGVWDEDAFEDFLDAGPIAFVPVHDQKLIYEYAFQAVEAFEFAHSFAHTDFEASGIDVSLELEVNGRTITLAYQKIQADEKLPENILMVLASIGRNLPSEYDRLFEFLKVPKLPPLPPEQAQKYAKCKLHDEWMKLDEVPVIYGYGGYSTEYEKLFPGANTFIWAGCMGPADANVTSKTLFCSSCRAAEKKWVKEYKSKYLPSPSGAPELPHGSSTSLPKKLINNP
jgi:hypothetical protein